MKFMASALLGAYLAGESVAQISGRTHVNPETRFFEDEFGRTVLFHGVNVVYKVAPFIPSNGEFDPQKSLNAEDI